MNLNRITTAVRPRNHWEALDLGFAMARLWWQPLYAAWFLLTLPIFVVLMLIFFWLDSLFWAALIFWWLLPLWERPLLHILSRALFDDIPTAKQAMRAFPALMRIQWFASLSYRRLSPTRSFDIAVIQLEKLQGRDRSMRLNILHQQGSYAAFLLTILSFFIQLFLYFGFLVLIYLFIPEELTYDTNPFDLLGGNDIGLLGVGLIYLVISAVAPFYIAGGFALYINRRTLLEAWDIELAFRRLALRFQQQQRSPNSTLTSVLIAFLCSSLFLATTISSPTAFAGITHEPTELTQHSTRERIADILADDEFHKLDSQIVIDSEDDEEEDEDTLELDFLEDFFNSLDSVFQALAQSIEVILWIIALTIIAILLLKYRHWIAEFVFPERKRRKHTPLEIMFGLDVRKESLPKDIPAAALQLWQQQQYRQALSLLYRGTLSALISHYGCEFEASFTEGECVKLVKNEHHQALSDYFFELTEQWKNLAYGHQLPSSTAVTSLCQRWRDFFHTSSSGNLHGDNAHE